MANVTKAKKTAVEAAHELIVKENQKKVELASKDLDKLIGEWSAKHNAALVVSGKFQGNQIQTSIQVVLK